MSAFPLRSLSSSPTSPTKPSPFDKTLGDHFRSSKSQVMLTLFSFALVVMAGGNWNLRYRLGKAEEELDSLKGGSDGGGDVVRLSEGQVGLAQKEVGRIVGVAVAEEVTGSWLGKGVLDKDGIERIRVRVEKEVAGIVRDASSAEVEEGKDEEEDMVVQEVQKAVPGMPRLV